MTKELIGLRPMDISEAAAHLGLDSQDIRKLANQGKLNGRKVGNKWQFYYYQVEACRRRLNV
jgi:excisionase family DNA binding protein